MACSTSSDTLPCPQSHFVLGQNHKFNQNSSQLSTGDSTIPRLQVLSPFNKQDHVQYNQFTNGRVYHSSAPYQASVLQMHQSLGDPAFPSGSFTGTQPICSLDKIPILPKMPCEIASR
ncbi:hypothetical protein Nepgr_031841 [Nepenthes gracilis]|uniref:Uncharacterized protein n=1 Tax=Nepenthes gracilis TaxID=150966 RepID=A0AAD3Y5I0_NEPGR|nr:hypothetical protein Nepgr_031841 [Nepenthes gracilis]